MSTLGIRSVRRNPPRLPHERLRRTADDLPLHLIGTEWGLVCEESDRNAAYYLKRGIQRRGYESTQRREGEIYRIYARKPVIPVASYTEAKAALEAA